MPQFNKVFNLFVDWHRTDCRHKQKTDKVRKGSKFSKPKSDRTEQLGLPHTRTLMANREIYSNVLDEGRLKCLEGHLKMSLNTIYAKLLVEKQNQKNNEECFLSKESKQSKMSKEAHKMWLLNISRPKQIFSNNTEEEQKPESKKEVDYNRIGLLAMPKIRPTQKSTKITVSKSALAYNASEKIKHLAKPRWLRHKHVPSPITETPRIIYRPNPAYKAIKSKGIKYLSLPQRKTEKCVNMVEQEVNNIVKKATFIPEANDYVCQLAQPKRQRDIEIVDLATFELENDGYILPVSRAALKYEATDHILQLSRPKKIRQLKENDPIIQKEKAMRKLANRWYYEHVSPAALKHEATPRIRNLAKPKDCIEIEQNDFKVKKSALKKVEKKKEKIYKNLATPLPRNCTPKFEIPVHAIS